MRSRNALYANGTGRRRRYTISLKAVEYLSYEIQRILTRFESRRGGRGWNTGGALTPLCGSIEQHLDVIQKAENPEGFSHEGDVA